MIDCKQKEKKPDIRPGRFSHRCIEAALLLLVLYASSTSRAMAYPEYQQFVEDKSGRTVNCAMCHTNENGPTGNGPGQIGSLKPEDFDRLNKARAALEPGLVIDSPILNEFGNKIIEAVGKKKFVELKQDPAKLAELLGKESDLDKDGLADGEEFLDGTDPLNKLHGDPAKLFWINLERYRIHVVLAIVAVLLLNYGLVHLIKGIANMQKRGKA